MTPITTSSNKFPKTFYSPRTAAKNQRLLSQGGVTGTSEKSTHRNEDNISAKRAITRGTIHPKPLMLEFVQENLFAPLSDRKDKKDDSASGRLYPPGADPKNTILRFVKRDDKADG
jgi:hypothetical protein